MNVTSAQLQSWLHRQIMINEWLTMNTNGSNFLIISHFGVDLATLQLSPFYTYSVYIR